ncbi:MAG: transglycosylase SLT domain-containing protein [Herpetosiphonaceae bacterium]|nr:transglycosylase SLT domain-containing protein [Herpetosiphonaceae bacterium]
MRRLYLLLVLGVIVACAAPQRQAANEAGQALAGLTNPTPPAAQPVGTPAPNDQLFALALDQRLAGEYAPMATTLHVLEQHPDPPRQREIAFHLAEAAFLQHAPGAVATLEAFVAQSPQHDLWYTQALFLLGRAQEDVGDYQAAIMTYARYRDLHTLLEPYAMLRAAAQQAAAGDKIGQIATLEAAAKLSLTRSQQAAALEQLISLYAAANDTGHLLARYNDLIMVASKPEYRAQLLWRAAQAASGEQRQRWLLQLVNELPLEPQAADAAQALAGGGLAPYMAARILHWHDRWAAAIPLFDAALQGQLTPQDRFEAQRLRALDLRGQGDFAGALQALGTLAQAQPPSPATLQAELDYVQTAGQSGNHAWAIDGYRRFAATHPADQLAPEALWRVVQLQQSDDQNASIASAEQLGHTYPKSEQAHTALPEAALFRYQHGDYDAAVIDWQLLATGAEGEASAEGYFWAGATLLEHNQAQTTRQALVAANAAAPASYYGARARELLKQDGGGSLALGTVATAEERRAVEQWLQSWLTTSVPAVNGGWLPDLVQAPVVQRARALAAVDLHDEASAEWFAAGEAWNDEPVHLWQLALLANREGYAYPALKFAERIVALSPVQRITTATPAGLLRLIYPTPYARVVQQYALQSSLDPRLLYGLLRQESLFNPDATSWVGALGLAQVMPSTAAGIAQNLGVSDFQSDQLHLPALAIHFGAYYLGNQLRAFAGNVQAAAAAYNGGPGNAQRWLEQTSDHDLFTELIDYRESRDYVKLVYGNWGMYRALYGG